jgi:hypothetical protein
MYTKNNNLGVPKNLVSCTDAPPEHPPESQEKLDKHCYIERQFSVRQLYNPH